MKNERMTEIEGKIADIAMEIEPQCYNSFNGKYYVISIPTVSRKLMLVFCKDKDFKDVFLKVGYPGLFDYVPVKLLFKKKVEYTEVIKYADKNNLEIKEYYVINEL